MDEEIQDPSTEGVGGLSGLKGLNQQKSPSQYMEVDRKPSDYVSDRKAQELTTSKRLSFRYRYYFCNSVR